MFLLSFEKIVQYATQTIQKQYQYNIRIIQSKLEFIYHIEVVNLVTNNLNHFHNGVFIKIAMQLCFN